MVVEQTRRLSRANTCVLRNCCGFKFESYTSEVSTLQNLKITESSRRHPLGFLVLRMLTGEILAHDAHEFRDFPTIVMLRFTYSILLSKYSPYQSI